MSRVAAFGAGVVVGVALTLAGIALWGLIIVPARRARDRTAYRGTDGWGP